MANNPHEEKDTTETGLKEEQKTTSLRRRTVETTKRKKNPTTKATGLTDREMIVMGQIAMSGEYPFNNRFRMLPSPTYAQKALYNLEAKGLIRKWSKQTIHGYRLTSRGKQLLMGEKEGRFEGYFEGHVETNEVSGNPERRDRLHLLAEAITLVHNTGAKVYRDEKPRIYGSLFADERLSQFEIGNPTDGNPSANNALRPSQTKSGNPTKRKPLKSGVPTIGNQLGELRENKKKAINLSELVITTPYFYLCREQKLGNISINTGVEAKISTDAIKGSRATGVLLAPNGVFAVYNTGNRLRRWVESVEMQYQRRMKDDFCRHIPQYNKKEVAGVFMGTNMEVLKKHLEAPKSVKSLTAAYQSLFYITNDKYGEAQMKILSDPVRFNALKGMLAKESGYTTAPSQITMEHDAATESGEPVLLCCLLDIPRLIRFRDEIQTRRYNGQIICFDFQAEMLRGYVGEKVEFKVVNFEKLNEKYFGVKGK